MLSGMRESAVIQPFGNSVCGCEGRMPIWRRDGDLNSEGRSHAISSHAQYQAMRPRLVSRPEQQWCLRLLIE